MINLLPDLVLEILIDRFLNYEDMINLKLTCKQLKVMIDEMKFKNLYIFLNCNQFSRKLSITNETISYSNSIRLKDLKLLDDSSRFRSTFENVIKMTIYHQQFGMEGLLKIDLNILNYFQYLEHLEIYGHDRITGQLNLENLKFCSLFARSSSKFEINAKRLRSLHLDGEVRPKLIDETSFALCYLSIDFRFQDHSEWLNESNNFILRLIGDCQNLICLSITNIDNLNAILNKISTKELNLRSLKEIRIGRITRLSGIKDLIENLLYLNNDKIDVFFSDKLMSIDDFIKISNLDPDVRFDLDAKQMKMIKPKYYYLLSNVSKLRIKNADELDERWIIKLTNLEQLSLRNRSKIDDKIFELMIQTFKDHLNELHFASPFISQNQYELISRLVLKEISIIFTDDYKIESYDFLTRFNNLIFISFHRDIEKEILIFLIENCFSLKLIFLVGRQKIAIHISKNKNFKIFTSPLETSSFEKELNFDSIETMTDHYYSNDLFHQNFVITHPPELQKSHCVIH